MSISRTIFSYHKPKLVQKGLSILEGSCGSSRVVALHPMARLEAWFYCGKQGWI